MTRSGHRDSRTVVTDSGGRASSKQNSLANVRCGGLHCQADVSQAELLEGLSGNDWTPTGKGASSRGIVSAERPVRRLCLCLLAPE